MRIILILVVLLATVSKARCADFDLKKGSLTYSGSFASQFISITNNTGALVRFARVECEFFRNDEFLVQGLGMAQKIEPKQTAFVEVIADNAALSTRTECRIVTP